MQGIACNVMECRLMDVHVTAAADDEPTFTEFRMLDAATNKALAACSTSNQRSGQCKLLPVLRTGFEPLPSRCAYARC